MRTPESRFVTKFAAPLFLFIVFFIALISGCGYTQEVVLPNNIKTISIPTFKDEIPPDRRFAYRPGLEIELTNAVIDRFIFDGNLRVVEETKADAVLEGTIISYEQEGLRFDDLESVEEYRLFLVASLKLVDQRTSEILIEEPNFSGRSEFFTSRSPANVRRSAASGAVTDFARSVVDLIVEGW